MQTTSSDDSADADEDAAEKEEEVLATGDETKQMLARVERVGRICPGQFLANGSKSFSY